MDDRYDCFVQAHFNARRSNANDNSSRGPLLKAGDAVLIKLDLEGCENYGHSSAPVGPPFGPHALMNSTFLRTPTTAGSERNVGLHAAEGALKPAALSQET
jgi:hypothetical protein